MRRDGRTLRILLGIAVAIALAAGAAAQETEGETLDLSEFLTATCDLVGLRAVPPEGWFNASVRNPPPGHRGCQMMRTTETDELVGLIRLRSLDTEAAEFADEGFDAFVADELAVLATMGYVVGEPLWARDDVPVAGEGLGSGRAAGFEATLEGGPPQEIHLLVFRGAATQYLLVLATPARSHDAETYRANETGFATLITTLQQPVGGPH